MLARLIFTFGVQFATKSYAEPPMTSSRFEPERELPILIGAAKAAAIITLESFGGDLDHETKSDASPVTEADRAAERVIVDALTAAFPGVPIVAEEEIASGHVPPDLGRRFFLVDPLDGTREFVAGLPDFTVNIGLIEDGLPVCGVVLAPAYGELFIGSRLGAFKSRQLRSGDWTAPQIISARLRPRRLLALASRSHRTSATDGFLADLQVEAVVPVGSSLKFCRIAEGAADLYPCLGRTMEWDIAAGHALLSAAGGSVTRPDGGALAYGQRGRPDLPDFANPHFVASGPLAPR
jgi:3'(2'), 5'-bisphosphate nucleotidase